MVDISARNPLSSPPDRRLLSQLTQDPKLIKYLENLWVDQTQVTPENFDLILALVVNAAEMATSAQGSSNVDAQGIAELALAIQSLESSATAVRQLVEAFSDLSSIVQAPDQAIQGLQRRVDELDNQLVEIRPPIPQVIPPATPPFAPALANTSAGYAVLPAPAYQPLTVRADASGTGFSVYLPPSPFLLQLVNIKKIDASANVVIVDGVGLSIDGALTSNIGTQYKNLQVQFNGSTWDVL